MNYYTDEIVENLREAVQEAADVYKSALVTYVSDLQHNEGLASCVENNLRLLNEVYKCRYNPTERVEALARLELYEDTREVGEVPFDAFHTASGLYRMARLRSFLISGRAGVEQ